jgi:two-component system phosphate regulon sensor histidine kinase PhoR
VRSRLFWKLGIAHLVLIFVVVSGVDFYVVRSLRTQYLNAGFAELQSYLQLAESQPPNAAAPEVLHTWALWMARAGTRVTLVGTSGMVLADSEEDPGKMDNHASRPEIRDAIERGSGRAVRYSATLGRDLLYLSKLVETGDGKPLIIRISLPLHRLDEAVAQFRGGLWLASGIILIGAATVSLLFFRNLSNRIERLKQFSARVASGDFRPLSLDRKSDELSTLAETLNRTASRLDATVRTLTEERNQSAAVLASMAEGVAVIGPGQRAVFCNAAFRNAMNLENETPEGRPAVEAIPNADLLSLLEQAQASHAAVSTDLAVGSVRVRSYAVTLTPISSDSGVSGFVMVLHDITEIRRLERARQDFVANVSHEFKTPLTAIRGFAETLLDGALEDPQNSRRFLNIIRDHAERLSRLTEDLLKLSQIEAGKLEMRTGPVAIAAALGPCLETIRLKAEEKRITVESAGLSDLPSVHGDALALQQVFLNLLDNAVRYTPEDGRISIRGEVVLHQLMVSITDNGPGIPKTEQGRVFERFYRTDAARSREAGGTGLGLSIAKHLAEAHGGRIELHSEIGQGTTFTVVLPLP